LKPAKFIQLITRTVAGISYLYALDEEGEIWKLYSGRSSSEVDIWRRVPTKRE
jgi:hypothetical protein